MLAAGRDRPESPYSWLEILPFAFVHLLAVTGVVYYGWSWAGFGLAAAVYVVLMFAVTGFLHRYCLGYAAFEKDSFAR